MSYPKVSIIIVNWNGLEDTIECLESLEKITYPNYEVTVVDNASQGDDAQVLKERYGHWIQVIANEENLGFAEGCNVAIGPALERGADYCFLFQPDAVADPECVTELVKVAETNVSIGTLGPKIYYYDKPEVIASAGFKIHWWLGRFESCGRRQKDIGQYNELAERDYISGAALFIKRKVLERIGLLDPTCWWGRDDCDFGTRAHRAGFKAIYVPTARVWHKYARSSDKAINDPETLRRLMQSTGFLDIKNIYKFFRQYSTFPPFIVPVFCYLAITKPLDLIRLLFIHRDIKWVVHHISHWLRRLVLYYWPLKRGG